LQQGIAHQTLGSTATHKPIGLDLAYADWRFMQGGNAVLGKQPGRASDPGSWGLGALYQSVDKDALFGQIADSDSATASRTRRAGSSRAPTCRSAT
jgi:hypothetical protein